MNLASDYESRDAFETTHRRLCLSDSSLDESGERPAIHSADWERLTAGTVFARDFEVVSLIGEGGMGAVYEVRQRSTGRRRALKIMHSGLSADSAFVDRFVREATIGSRIESDHVVDVICAGIDDHSGKPYLVMEMLVGETLEQRIETKGALGWDISADVLAQLCHALGAAHRAGVVHRDLKPANILLARRRRAGERGVTVKLLDLGIAKFDATFAAPEVTGEEDTIEPKQPIESTSLGTPLWMAPEQVAGIALPSTDVWALGLVTFYAMTGHSFWCAGAAGGSFGEVLREVMHDPIVSASARALSFGAPLLPPGFDDWFARCVNRSNCARFADANTAWDALNRILDPLGASDRSASGST